MQEEHEFFGMDWYVPHCHATEILDVKYETVLVDDVIDQLTHLNAQQKSDIRQVLNEHTKLFDGTSREGLCQVYDGMYKFLSVTNFGGH
jgi:hypothetical protein